MCRSMSSPTSNGPYRSEKCLVRSFLFAFNPLMATGVSHLFQLDESIFNYSVVGMVFFILIHILMEQFVSKQWRP